MLTKLKALREEREEGFTLIELLVVILIIGILAAIAIPVFLNQRQTANDGAVESDVRNAVSQVETWVSAQKGAATKIDDLTGPPATTDLTQIKAGIKASTGVKLAIQGDANSYCIKAVHINGKKYVGADAVAATTNVATYDSLNGGLNKGTISATVAAGNPCSGPTTGWKALN